MLSVSLTPKASLFQLAWIINGLVGGPLLGVFLLGMLTRTAEGVGALVGVVCGSLALLVVMASKRGCTDGACVGGCCDTWLGSLGAVAFFFCEGPKPGRTHWKQLWF